MASWFGVPVTWSISQLCSDMDMDILFFGGAVVAGLLIGALWNIRYIVNIAIRNSRKYESNAILISVDIFNIHFILIFYSFVKTAPYSI